LEIIDAFTPQKKRLMKPIRACIYDFYSKAKEGSKLSGDIVSLKLQQGIIKTGNQLLLMPNETEVTVKAI
jgi:translation elongation factor EF-1alpha